MEELLTITKDSYEEMRLEIERYKHQARIHEAKVLELLGEIRQLKKKYHISDFSKIS